METRLSLKFICLNTSQANSCRRSGEFVSKSLRVCMCVCGQYSSGHSMFLLTGVCSTSSGLRLIHHPEDKRTLLNTQSCFHDFRGHYIDLYSLSVELLEPEPCLLNLTLTEIYSSWTLKHVFTLELNGLYYGCLAFVPVKDESPEWDKHIQVPTM